jgi:uncharacterized protein YaeQ
MALKSTIYKAELQLADIDRNHYDSYTLTLARHPSETESRLMLRLLAFALHADPALKFGRGISDTDEPDLWRHDLTGALQHWIELGLPDERRISRAAGRVPQVDVFTYGPSGPWWAGVKNKLERLKNVRVRHIADDELSALAALAERSLRLHVTVQDDEVLVSSERGSARIMLETIKN